MARDALGNELQKGQAVMISYNGQPTIAIVREIREGGVIGRSADALPVAGLCLLQIMVPIEFMGDQVNGVWVLRMPSNREQAMDKPTPEAVS